MSFDTIAFVVTADPLGSIETSVGVPLTTALTSDPDKGCPTILSTTGVSAARCLVPFVTTDGEICFGVAPAPKKEAAYVSSGLVTASGAAATVLRRCEVFSSTATVQTTSGTASCVRRVSFSSTPATRTTSGSVGYIYQRCEVFSSTATVCTTSGGAGCICGIIQRAVPENTQTFGDTGTVISLHFSSNAAARSTSGSVLVSTGDSLRSLGIAEVSGAAQVIVSSVKNGSGTWHSYGSAGLSYNALFSLINSHKERRVFVERDSRKCEIARGNFGAVLDREPRGDVCPQAPTRIKIAPNYQRGDVFPGPLRMVHRDESIRGGIVKLLEVA